MIQNKQVLTRKDNRISVISAGGTTMQEDYLIIAEGEIPVNTTQLTWTFGVGEETRVGRTTPRLVSTLANIIKWLNHLGSERIDDSRLEARHNIHGNFRAKGIGL